MWFTGIDWADHHHDAVVVSEGGEVLGHVQVAHTVEGLAQLVAFMRQFTLDPEQLVCVVETNHGLLITAACSLRRS